MQCISNKFVRFLDCILATSLVKYVAKIIHNNCVYVSVVTTKMPCYKKAIFLASAVFVSFLP